MRTVTAETNIPTPHSIETAARTLVLIDKAFHVMAEGGLVDLRCGPMHALQIERDKLINGEDEQPDSKAAYAAADRILYIIQSGGNYPFMHRDPNFGYNDPADDEDTCNGIPSPRINPVEYRPPRDNGNSRKGATGCVETAAAVAGEAMESGTVVRAAEDGTVRTAGSAPNVQQIPREDGERLAHNAAVEERLLSAQERLNAAAARVDAEAAEIDRLVKLIKPAEHKVVLSADEYEALLRNQKKKGGRKPKLTK